MEIRRMEKSTMVTIIASAILVAWALGLLVFFIISNSGGDNEICNILNASWSDTAGDIGDVVQIEISSNYCTGQNSIVKVLDINSGDLIDEINQIPLNEELTLKEWEIIVLDEREIDEISYRFEIFLEEPPSEVIESSNVLNVLVDFEIDTDSDGIFDQEDNCADSYNPLQEDINEDGIGDWCEDSDSDGVIDSLDLCPFDETNNCPRPLIIKDNLKYSNYWVAQGNVLTASIESCSEGDTYSWAIDGEYASNGKSFNILASDIDIGNHVVNGICRDSMGNADIIEFNLEILSEEDFVIVAYPDTQAFSSPYAGGNLQMFLNMTQWTVDSKYLANIVFVTHLGDMANNVGNGNLGEITRVNESMSILDGEVPFGTAIGNHDYTHSPTLTPGVRLRNATDYNIFFPLSRYQNMPGFGGSYLGTAENFYQYFSSGDLEFLIMHYEYCPRDEVIEWANGIISNNQDKRVMISTHNFLSGNVRGGSCLHFEPEDDFNHGNDQWEKLVSKHPNTFLIQNGHTSVNRRSDPGISGNIIHQVMTDYQFSDNGGNGYLSILIFRPNENRIDFKTYSPYLDITDSSEYEELLIQNSSSFSLDYPMSKNILALFNANPIEGNNPLEVNFDASGSISYEGNIQSYAWDFENDGTIDDTGVKVIHIFEETGVYDVKLTIENDIGESDYSLMQVIVTERECIDGIDNDFDGIFDLEDPDCNDENDNFEGHTPTCQDADFNSDRIVNNIDNDILFEELWGCGYPPACEGDINQDGVVNYGDSSLIIGILWECTY